MGLGANWSTPAVIDSLRTYSRPQVDHRLTLALGSDGQGISFHSHADSYAVQLHGRKRWAVCGLGALFGLQHSVEEVFSQWLRRHPEFDRNDELPGAQAGKKTLANACWQCIQEPGQLLYVPEGYHHATASIGQTVGIVHRASTLAKGSARSLWQRGKSLLKTDARKSAKLLTQATLLDSSNVLYWLDRAAAYHRIGKLNHSVACLRRARDANALDQRAHAQLHDVLRSLGRHREAKEAAGEAVRCLSRAIGVFPLPGDAYAKLIDGMRGLGKRREAERVVTEAEQHGFTYAAPHDEL
eukprot:TRINITY_DN19821_c0_g1_i3.p1 TRINITY_DN19821_c0_g1~~TRINITY_DN19821_c0_g1_i3.p1  ORF type:complete len:298 (+),score=35.73 TRINITY_DN19821_c0_g1_i3:574-1467(+)